MATEEIFRFSAESKICSKCGQKKSRSEFNKEHGRERAYCKECHKAQTTSWVHQNREKRRAYSRQWAAQNNAKRRAAGLPPKRHKHSPEALLKKAEYQKRRHLANKYGITPEDWQDMYAAQGGVCAVCRIPGRVGKHGKLAVDHCHTTGRVRGLLCGPCNVAIGILGETPEQWEVVSRYLRGS